MTLKSATQLIAAVSVLAWGCEDPVRSARIESLGPEPGTYPVGPNHRGGQPCTWCHTKGGTARHFDLAGTVYARPSSQEPTAGVRVRLFDESGGERSVLSNEAGNFYFAEGELKLTYPIWVKLELEGEVVAMQTPIFRETSCAGCHREPASPSSPGQIYLQEDPP